MTRDLLKLFKESGWDVKKTKKGHYKVTTPDGAQHIYISGTPSDYRSDKNSVRDLRRIGYDVLKSDRSGKRIVRYAQPTH